MGRFMIVGDTHGRQDAMYETALEWEQTSQQAIDAILQVGDFETIFSEEDFVHYYAPQKYHHISDLSEYFKGIKEAPFLTVFIGGNHEAWSVLADHPQGGFVLPNVYYLGRAGTISIKGATIGGMTGIFSQKFYRQPLSKEPTREWKYYRKEQVEKLKELSQENPLDILLLHDWIRPLANITVKKNYKIPDSWFADTSTTPTYPLVLETQPKHVFMGHAHFCAYDGALHNSHLRALTEFSDGKDPHSYSIIEINE